eukprot:m.15405 g.15405  ORF g.15405 m.15405 type:complete len:62 (-) comp5384_c0_seq1:208-393(-)
MQKQIWFLKQKKKKKEKKPTEKKKEQKKNHKGPKKKKNPWMAKFEESNISSNFIWNLQTVR